jgi:hypothetical protein
MSSKLEKKSEKFVLIQDQTVKPKVKIDNSGKVVYRSAFGLDRVVDSGGTENSDLSTDVLRDQTEIKNDKSVNSTQFSVKSLLKAPMGRIRMGNRNLVKGMSKQIGQHYTTWLNVTGTLTSSAGGLYDGAIPFDPSGYTDWTDFAVIFDEYRMVSTELLMCVYVDGTTNFTGAIIVAPDNDSVSAPGSLGGITEYQDCHLLSSTSRVTSRYRFHRPDLTASAYWTDVQSPNTTTCGAWKFNGAGFSASQPVFRYLHKMKVEFRMRV